MLADHFRDRTSLRLVFLNAGKMAQTRAVAPSGGPPIFQMINKNEVGTVSLEIRGQDPEELPLCFDKRAPDFDYKGLQNRLVVTAFDSAERCATFQLISQVPQTKN